MKKLISAKIHQVIYYCVQAKSMINNNSKATIIIYSGNNGGRWPPVYVSQGKNKILSFSPTRRIRFEEYPEDALIN